MYLKLQYVRLEVHTKHSQKQNDKLQKIYAITKAIFLYYINNILIAIKINKTAKYSLLDNPTGIFVPAGENLVVMADLNGLDKER